MCVLSAHLLNLFYFSFSFSFCPFLSPPHYFSSSLKFSLLIFFFFSVSWSLFSSLSLSVPFTFIGNISTPNDNWHSCVFLCVNVHTICSNGINSFSFHKCFKMNFRPKNSHISSVCVRERELFSVPFFRFSCDFNFSYDRLFL